MKNTLILKMLGRNSEAEALFKSREKETLLELIEEAKRSVEAGAYEVEVSVPSGDITLSIKNLQTKP
ncbi:hypothetical protein LZX74_000153 [Salmonella enterica]|nr:hypothetical protein [Salmonella enterica]EEN8238264.1 hypothetical protein [Salmonella enterica subsp. enterica serovar Newport]EBN2836872.1 hypothetical protein [Salmonella enterica]EBU0596651.1 hypothetical protein [Salmonella enterica]ECJ2698384.1 hypothetical protein [Salmonella enterica]